VMKRRGEGENKSSVKIGESSEKREEKEDRCFRQESIEKIKAIEGKKGRERSLKGTRVKPAKFETYE